MLNKVKLIFIALLLVLLFSSNLYSQVIAGVGNQESIISTVVTSDETLEFTLQIPWQKLIIKEIVINGNQYTQINLPGWSNNMASGEPTIPFWNSAIGVPFGSEISIDVTPGKSHFINLDSILLPAPTQTIDTEDLEKLADFEDFPVPKLRFEPNLDIYNQMDTFPDTLGHVTSDANIRQQRVLGIGIYPFQYHPNQHQLQVYETLDIKINFANQNLQQTMGSSDDSEFFEAVLRKTIINYDQARSWRQIAPQPLDKNNSPDSEQIITDASITPWSPPEPGWRINIKEEGAYQITYSELSSAGLPVETINPNTFQLFHSGEEIAIDFLGDDDNSFEGDESIFFFGQSYENKYTDKNVYWLTYGQTTGLRMSERDVNPGSASSAESFPAIKRMEENHSYSSAVPGDDHFERFMWAYIKANDSLPADWEHSFSLTAPFDGSGKLLINLLGYIERSVNPDHHVILYLENTAIGKQQLAEEFWDGVAWQNLEIDLPAGYLMDGENSLIVEAVNDTGGVYDRIYVDNIEIHYPAHFSVEGNYRMMHYEASGDWLFEINGFTSTPQGIFDVTIPSRVENLVNFNIIGSEEFTLQFQDEVTGPTNYFTWGEGTVKSVTSITPDQTSNLQSTSNQADYILITPDEFSDQAQVLVDHRQSPQLQAMKVHLQDIYDQFNFGISDANTIHDFLQYTYESWESPAPSYVVLLGDGHYDPKDYLGYGRTSYIPPFLAVVDPWIKETSSDNRYVTVSGEDTLPDMMIGRLSVSSEIEAENFINKILAYEDNSDAADWQTEILAIADDSDSGGDFPSYSDSIINDYVPEYYSVDKVYFGITHTTEESARTAIKNSMNDGAMFVNFIGHAYYTGWTGEDLFTTADVPLLENGIKMPINLAMTCYEGLFHRPNELVNDHDALGEIVTKTAGRGAVASWSPTGLGVASGHDFLNRGFYDAFFNDKVDTLGEAILQGKIDLWTSGGNYDLLDTYMIFGDPATKFSRSFRAVDDNYQTNEDSLLEIDSGSGVLANDAVPAGVSPSIELVDDVQNGSLNLETNGSFSYDPNLDWYGVDDFTYRIFDGSNYSNTATVTINVLSVNDPPIAYSQTLSTPIDTPLDITLTATDDGTGGSGPWSIDESTNRSTLTYEIVVGPSNGNLEYVELPNLTYHPNEDYSGVDSFTFRANDGQLNSNIATISINVGSDSFSIFLPMITK